MPTYSIQGPDGKTYSIDGPEGATREQVIAKIQEKQKSGLLRQIGDTALDVGHSLARGVGKGLIGIAGIPGDISEGMTELGDYISGDLLGQDTTKFRPAQGMPTSGDIQHGVEQVTGEFGTPETTLGHYAESIGEFAPMALGSPEEAFVKNIRPGVRAAGSDVMRAMGRTPTGRVATSAAARSPADIGAALKSGAGARAAGAVAGGVGAEAAGELTDDNPWARAAGGLAGGGLVGLKGIRDARSEKASRLLNADELNAKADQGYDQIRSHPAVLDRMAVRMEGSRIYASLDGLGYDIDHIAPKTMGIINKDFIVDRGNHGLTANEILKTYQKLGHVNPSEGAEYAAAQIAREDIRDTLQAHPQWKTLKNAMGDWAASEKSKDIETLLKAAYHRAQNSGSGGNFANTMRQEVRKIIDNANKARGFTPEELDEMETIVNGSNFENIARLVGKLSPEAGAQSTVFALATGIFTSPSLGLGMAAGGHIFKKLAENSTNRRIEDLGHLIREQAPSNKRNAALTQTTTARSRLQSKANLARGGVAGAESETGNGEPERITVHPGSYSDALNGPTLDDLGNFAKGGIYGVMSGRGHGSEAGDTMANVAQGLGAGAMWTGPEVQALKLAMKASKSWPEIAKLFPGKNLKAIQQQAYRIIGKGTMRPQRNWTKEEIDHVMLSGKSIAELEQDLGRSQQSIYDLKSRVGRPSGNLQSTLDEANGAGP